ncbi:MAG TPA: AAA family ATPase [Candidatus Limnocylindria bacterium]|nr:AAA family ATPase [Candidatus Limnocylindria bacterium]
MSDFSKISYYDLKLEALNKRLPAVVGFEAEVDRLNRIITRKLQHNAVISAPSGCGKTALIYAWAKNAAKNPGLAHKKIALLNAGTLQKIGQLPQSSLMPFMDAFQSLENCVLIIDSFGEMVYQSLAALQNWNTLLKPLFFKDDINIILSMQPEELAWLTENKSHFLSHFETLKLEPLPQDQQLEILKQAAQNFGKHFELEDGVLELILKLCKRFPSLGQLPKSAIRLLDEGLADAKTGLKLTKAAIEKIAAEKTGVPQNRLSEDDKTLLKNLPNILQAKIVGQTPALSKMVSVIQRARLGLRSQTKPLGSFLLLGPSGVGKTETAKILAQELYGSEKNFLRIDMSEFGESHSPARLLGSPAGYVGYEQGGQLTNHFQNYPFSLLLLDEIEKAHSKVFDIFLQILDDGRITSASGQTVDLTQSIIMATSNLAVQEILDGFALGKNVNDGEFVKKAIIPKLLQHFRMEFLNRFDAIIIYKPLSAEDLTDIAMLEIQKIEHRMKEHNIKFSISRDILTQQLIGLADPRFGARPVKRFIEETCENLITEQLLK